MRLSEASNEALPLVSIIICFHDLVAETARCVASVVEHSEGVSYELILVDDGSTEDGVEQLASYHANLRLVRLPVNQGFTKAANRGAATARGRFILFLNNDTRASEGWLSALLAAVESGPEVAVVGARLLYPDGRLQEAGGFIWEDGTGINFGKGDDPSRSRYGFRREVDYCSGAALLVEREFFERTGGFDELFAPGFYEDTDLCFRARALGRVVLYEPFSSVVHLEGATFGTETAVGSSTVHTKASQEVNRLRFRAKWAETLLRHYPPGTAAGLRGGAVDQRPRVLVGDTEVPAPDRDSGGLRMTWILRILHQLGCEVTFFPTSRIERQPYADNLRRAGIEVHCDAQGLEDFGRDRAGLIDLVIISRPDPWYQMYGTCRRYFSNAHLVYDTVDLHFVREERRIRALETGAEVDLFLHRQSQLRRRELDYMIAADSVGVVTDEDRRLLFELVPAANIVTLPNVHAERREKTPPLESREGLLFIGSYRHPPNADAIVWYRDEILPLLRDHGKINLVALGSDPADWMVNASSDEFLVPGYLEDVTEYFDRSRVFVAPLRYGAGMKGKIGQAMSLGLPVVTTSIGAEGMEIVDGVHALVADTPVAFAGAVRRLSTEPDLWEQISKNARELVGTKWGPTAMSNRLSEFLVQVGLAGRLRTRLWASPMLDGTGNLTKVGDPRGTFPGIESKA
jgi:GT2 family glycosyltransferase